jgi:hypothetical protein
MLTFFKNLISKNSNHNQTSDPGKKEKYTQAFSKEPYNFRTIELDELLKDENAIWELYTNQKDGFLIKNFLTEKEVDTVMSNFDKALNDNPAYTAVGFTYPPIFAEFSNRIKQETSENKKIAIEDYFKRTETFNEDFKNNFGVNIKGKIESLFNSLAGGREVGVADGMNEKGHYPFGTMRYLTPEKGLMSVHCGNYFGKTFEESYSDLTKKVAVENQMSYFIMLQEPEEGGELTLFNFRWKAGQTKINPSEDNEIIQPDGSKMYVENTKEIIKDKIRPKKGDMILFQGGNIWHRVETVKGATPRITFGGFIGMSLNKDKIYYWS